MTCKRYSEIDFELYEIVSGPHYECPDCEGCYSVSSRTDSIFSNSQSCNCDGNSSSTQCYITPECGVISKTDFVDIPPNPFIPSYSSKTSPSESGKLCLDNNGYKPIRVSNKIKISIPYDPIFNGIYVFDKCSIGWILNSGESTININSCFNTGDVNQTPHQLISFSEVDNPSDINKCYIETYSNYNLGAYSGDIYAFPAKYYMCATQPASSITDIGHRLSVGFTLPIRYRPRCKDWVLIDRLYGPNGKKTPHSIFGSPNYAYYQNPTNGQDYLPRYTFLTSDNQIVCGSGINEIGFSFKCQGQQLGYGCNNICNYSYNNQPDTTYPVDETSWFKPKIPVLAQVEFVYDCRPQCDCVNIINYNEIGGWESLNTKCYGSSVNINYDCDQEINEPSFTNKEVKVYFVPSDQYRFYIQDNISSDIYYSTPISISTQTSIIDKVIKYPREFYFPGVDAVYGMIFWINNNVSVISTAGGEKINAVDIYWSLDVTDSKYKLYILPSED